MSAVAKEKFEQADILEESARNAKWMTRAKWAARRVRAASAASTKKLRIRSSSRNARARLSNWTERRTQ